MKKEGRKYADITGHCLLGIIIGAFLLFQIRLNDFTGNIFHRLLDAPKGIREEILEETKRRKKSYFRREIEEVQEILKTTDRGSCSRFYALHPFCCLPQEQPLRS